MPKLHKRRCWEGEGRRVNSGRTKREGKRTVFLSDGSWIVVVHHPGKKLMARLGLGGEGLAKKRVDRSADDHWPAFFLINKLEIENLKG
jgi:hypothetical protein